MPDASNSRIQKPWVLQFKEKRVRRMFRRAQREEKRDMWSVYTFNKKNKILDPIYIKGEDHSFFAKKKTCHYPVSFLTCFAHHSRAGLDVKSGKAHHPGQTGAIASPPPSRCRQ